MEFVIACGRRCRPPLERLVAHGAILHLIGGFTGREVTLLGTEHEFLGPLRQSLKHRLFDPLILLRDLGGPYVAVVLVRADIERIE